MDKISGFSDDVLLVKILSFLPTKDAVSTSILSKQWKFLWMRVPKLEYDDINIYMKRRFIAESLRSEKSQRMRSFINKNLPLHSSPFIESLYLRFFTASFEPEDIKLWVEIAVSRSVQELTVKFYLPKGISNCALLPTSLYTCESLMTLKLRDRILVDVPHGFCLPSLKTLHLENVTYADEESLQRLLSNCPVLEDLVVERRREGDNVTKFAVNIPSLLSLSIAISGQCSYVIDAPSLKYFGAKYFSESPSTGVIGNMPKLEEANITTGLESETLDIKKLLKPVASVKRLSLYILNSSAEAVYCDDSIFKELEHLNLQLFNSYWSKLVFWLLKASPKLRDLNCHEQFFLHGMDTLACWKQQTSSVPRCLLSSLQTFKWSGYHVSVEGRDLATYILRNSCLLKTAKVSIGPGMDPQKKLEMEVEVINSCRGSPTCNLVFD
ncbi:PREDICTED: putative FBD-associated F-box protein At5g56410 [Camelina sativa]|uniref:FBD-associated F-box protein At5g56410 n=1 Tax=Camelina sativa TaxID=90675 RepID=A0ABM1R9F8_CAMSA|nr:PREDICTED: putative FBD-associated F-box protein At5g56410 [Camelina sativa]